MDKLGPCKRYDSSFRKLWALCTIKGLIPSTSSSKDLVPYLLQLHDHSPNDARNAYSALLLLPGFSDLKFHPMLQKVKKAWNTSEPKYTDFWSMEPLLDKLSKQKLDWKNVKQLRIRLLLCLKFFHLMRSIDCARTQRTLSFLDDRPFILVQRKGWTQPRWEELIKNDRCTHFSPWHLLLKYVQLTKNQAQVGDHLFLNLHKPFKPLTSDRIASLTKGALLELGLSKLWGAHSTRGAAVAFCKRQGLSNEQIAQLRKWKDIKTFTEYYMRLQATQKATEVLRFLPFSEVHNVSPGPWADPDMSHSPPKMDFERGRSDMGGEAQEQGEPTQPTQKRPLSPLELHNLPSSKRQFCPQILSGLEVQSHLDHVCEDTPLRFTFADPSKKGTQEGGGGGQSKNDHRYASQLP